ncbi:hypothetical protein DNU06_01270 [Putridiphycobacter roseus]|uniref:Uncharacterized protein n=1 Tax=Putridiphycobacter roseus TaxID=2219161 RepID=A0A2W1NS68_9FLAO|nr:hypothetical protein [Putridiphycobacter roseus]PZE18492.1 hypothetical protein DNU06_01270 [Putridiphycobacter roseus]
MKKCFKTLAKEKLSIHQLSGTDSHLSVFEVAQLFDVITGKSDNHFFLTNTLVSNGICLN